MGITCSAETNHCPHRECLPFISELSWRRMLVTLIRIAGPLVGPGRRVGCQAPGCLAVEAGAVSIVEREPSFDVELPLHVLVKY